MPKKISLVDMRKWLQDWEQGKSVAAIAKDAKHDVRTITHGMQEARKEIEVRTARSDILRDALQKHQDDLTGVINSLQLAITAIKPLSLNLPVGHSIPRKVWLPQATAQRDDKGEWTITFELENSAKWELFQDHMKRDSMWKVLSQWKRTLTEHLKDRLALNVLVDTTLCERTDLKILEGTPKAGDNFLYPSAIQAISHNVLSRALGMADGVDLEKELRAYDPHLDFGSERIPILTAPGLVDDYKAKILMVFQELQKPSVTNKPATSYRAVEEITRKLNRAIEELLLMRMVPGECRVCRRLGV